MPSSSSKKKSWRETTSSILSGISVSIKRINLAFEPIRNKIKSNLESITSIQEVHDYPNMEVGGYPSALIASNRLEANFETTTQNLRTYVFGVYIIQDQEHDKVRARRVIEGVVDDIVQVFDKDQLLSGIDLETGETMIISYPILSEIYTSSENPKLLVGELEIKVVVSFDTTT